jgi:hypothetical protein
MGRIVVAVTVLVLATLVGGDAPAHADALPTAVEYPDPPLNRAVRHPCCLRGVEYRARTQFVTEMLRSVEGM